MAGLLDGLLQPGQSKSQLVDELVKQTAMSKLVDGDAERNKLQLEVAKTIAAEAANQGVKGMEAVGSVMGNRGKLWKKDIGTVISAKNQFYGYTAPNRDEIYKGVEKDAWRIAGEVIDGTLKDSTDGATFFRLEDEPLFSWHGDKTKTIGAHTFHKDK